MIGAPAGRRGGGRLPALAVLLLAAAVAPAQTRLDPAVFTPTGETLTSPRKQHLYLQLVENFVGWAESSGRFTAVDDWERGGGHFRAKGHGVTWARGNSNLCLVYALLLAEHPRRREFTVHRIPRQVLVDHLRRALRTVCLANRHCPGRPRRKARWGGPGWQSSLMFQGCAWAAHLCAGELDKGTLALVEAVATAEAEAMAVKEIPSGRRGNTRAEDCTWNAAYLAFAANRYANDPRARKWDLACRRWALNGVSIAGDSRNGRLVDGMPLRKWVVSENLYPDLTLENHGFWSVGYQCSFQHYGEAALAYRVFGRTPPQALSWRAGEMWRQVTSALFLGDGDIIYPSGQDWNWKIYSSIEYLCWLATCQGNAAAGAYESRALQMVYRRQLSLGTGELGADDFGNQSVKPKRWAFCYLMHKHFGGPERIPLRRAAKGSQGFHLFKHTRVAIHRTPLKCISASWHPRSQALYLLPEMESTFTAPPFFFPWDRRSTCPRVTVSPKPKRPRRLAPTLVEATATHGGRGMRVIFIRHLSCGIDHYVALVSLPDESTVFCSAFRAGPPAHVTVEEPFSLRLDAPPGWGRPVIRKRGERWLNLSDHIGFVATSPLPDRMPADRFYLWKERSWQVTRGQWFGATALVVYARQTRADTARMAASVKAVEGLEPGRVGVDFRSSSGPDRVVIDFRRAGR